MHEGFKIQSQISLNTSDDEPATYTKIGDMPD